VPLLAGWNADEGSYRMIFGKEQPTAANYDAAIKTRFKDNADRILKLYPGTTDAEAKRSAQDLGGDQFIAYSTWKWIEMQFKTGGSPVYRYQFDDALPLTEEAKAKGEEPTAYHSAEIEFVFGVLASKELPWRPEDHQLSTLMSDYWTNFAKTGDPNGAGLPHWPAYTNRDEYEVMHLSDKPHAAPDQHRARYEFLDTLSPYQ
jgi:para-nitrobenzyl esterase